LLLKKRFIKTDDYMRAKGRVAVMIVTGEGEEQDLNPMRSGERKSAWGRRLQ
jgi:hypothetical protein